MVNDSHSSDWIRGSLQIFHTFLKGEGGRPVTRKSVARFTRPVLPRRLYQSSFTANTWYNMTYLDYCPLD